jgi:transposase InsO family protein
VIDTLKIAAFRRRPAKRELLFHSNCGSLYASEDFRGVLKKHGLAPSMSRKG